MNRKVTVVGGAGAVGATVARAIADKELADVVIIDIADKKAAGVALDMLEACPIEGSDSRVIGYGANDEGWAATAGSDVVVINDRIADSVFQQILTRTADYDVFATPNLNGDYLSDACAAQVGGLGIAPGANIGDDIGFFEATHGTAPKYAGKDVINPGSVILSGVMMFKYLGWGAAAELVERGLEQTIKQKKVTYDLARQMEGATELKTSEFADAVIQNMK